MSEPVDRTVLTCYTECMDPLPLLPLPLQPLQGPSEPGSTADRVLAVPTPDTTPVLKNKSFEECAEEKNLVQHTANLLHAILSPRGDGLKVSDRLRAAELTLSRMAPPPKAIEFQAGQPTQIIFNSFYGNAQLNVDGPRPH